MYFYIIKLNNMTLSPIIYLLYRLWAHINEKRKLQIYLLIILMVFASLIEIITIGAVVPFLSILVDPAGLTNNLIGRYLTNILGSDSPQQILLPITLVFSCGILMSCVVRIYLLWGQSKVSNAIGTDFGNSIFRKTLYQNYNVHLERNSSEIITIIANKLDSIIFTTVMPLLTMAASIILLFSIVLTLIYIQPLIAVCALVGFSTIYYVIAILSKKSLQRDGAHASEATMKLTKILQEGLGGIRDILIDGTQEIFCNTYRTHDLKVRNVNTYITVISGTPRYAIEALSILLIIALTYISAQGTSRVVDFIPALGALALGAQRLIPLMQQLYSGWATMISDQTSLREVLGLLDQPLPNYSYKVNQKKLTFEHKIELRQVSFKYQLNETMVLSDINLVIPKGGQIGVIGKTGGGKTTLLDIVMGLLKPSSGFLLVDGIQLNEENCHNWQKNISHVPQNIYLSDATIAENIAFGILPSKIDLKKLKFATEIAQIDRTIEDLPCKFQTYIGERGVRLSGGQRQRLGIARAIYKGANVIVFDEATSALDNETEQSVIDGIKSLGSKITVLMIAHRLTSLQNCSNIIELENGTIIWNGTYEEMSSRSHHLNKS
ncbi:MdlB ABC-type multidrug transport system, ATPase and permease components [Burkholderiaceae bacterium]